jgi:hypothetical protein
MYFAGKTLNADHSVIVTLVQWLVINLLWELNFQQVSVPEINK